MAHDTHPSPNGAGHETTEVNVQIIVFSLIALLIGAFFVSILTIGIFRYFHNEYRPDQAAKETPQVIPPEPRVEEHPWEQLITVKAREDHVLSSYAWVDQKQGTVRVPIDRAIDMLAEKGLPSHDYLPDIEAGRKAPTPAKQQGSSNAK